MTEPSFSFFLIRTGIRRTASIYKLFRSTLLLLLLDPPPPTTTTLPNPSTPLVSENTQISPSTRIFLSLLFHAGTFRNFSLSLAFSLIILPKISLMHTHQRSFVSRPSMPAARMDKPAVTTSADARRCAVAFGFYFLSHFHRFVLAAGDSAPTLRLGDANTRNRAHVCLLLSRTECTKAAF